MIKTRILPALVALALAPGVALAAGGSGKVDDVAFSFEGPFGTYDSMQLQRGFQVYNNVCNGCHGLKHVPFRELGRSDGPALPEAQIKAIAAAYQCADPDLEPGETRDCRPSDNFPENTGAGAPDLSLMAKARAGFHGPSGLLVNQFIKGIGGPEYIYSLLVHYNDEEQDVGGNLLYGNDTMPGGWISMSQPLYGEDVEYGIFNEAGGEAEGHGYTPPEPTLEQHAEDVAAFLMWTAEPNLVERKEAGFRNLLMIVILTVLLYYTNKKLWAPVKRKD